MSWYAFSVTLVSHCRTLAITWVIPKSGYILLIVSIVVSFLGLPYRVLNIG